MINLSARKILKILILFFTIQGFSQKNYIVEYKIIELKTYSPIEKFDIETSNFYNKIVQLSKDIKYKLLINDKLTFFMKEELEYLEVDKRVHKFIDNFVSFNNFVYSNYETDSIIFKRNLIGQNFIVKSKKIDFNWVLENETKKIMGFEVKKAIGKYYSLTLKSELDIEAWYIPSLPLQSGPDVFMGLPGLIVEVHLNGAIITSSKIEFLDNVNLPNIDESNAISKEKYEKIIDDFTKKYIEN